MDRLTGARVATLVLLVRANGEAAEAPDLDPLALAERVDHRVEHLADEQLRAAVGELGPLRDKVYEIRLGHVHAYPRTVSGVPGGSQRLR